MTLGSGAPATSTAVHTPHTLLVYKLDGGESMDRIKNLKYYSGRTSTCWADWGFGDVPTCLRGPTKGSTLSPTPSPDETTDCSITQRLGQTCVQYLAKKRVRTYAAAVDKIAKRAASLRTSRKRHM